MPNTTGLVSKNQIKRHRLHHSKRKRNNKYNLKVSFLISSEHVNCIYKLIHFLIYFSWRMNDVKLYI